MFAVVRHWVQTQGLTLVDPRSPLHKMSPLGKLSPFGKQTARVETYMEPCPGNEVTFSTMIFAAARAKNLSAAERWFQEAQAGLAK